MHAMIAATDRQPIQPLFAYNARLWLRVWVATQGAALAVACWVMFERAGGVRAFLATPKAPRTLAVVALLIAYHVVGFRAHGWILRRRWAVALFVPAGWVIIFGSFPAASPFGLLVLGAIIQGFIFLPFAWAIGVLSLFVSGLVFMIVARARQDVSLTIAQAGSLLATGIMVGTVMLYIHRVNRDAVVRARLLRQLDDAQRDLAERAKEAGVQEERQRLARDIHDTLAQGFASVIRHLEAVELSIASGNGNGGGDTLRDAAPHLAHAQAVSRSSLAEIRRLVWALRPAPLAESTLGSAIERLVSHWGEANGVAVTCTIDELPPLQPDADVIFLRAAQEALSNVARHAHATRVAVALHCVDRLVLLSVEDDGRGLVDADTVGAGKVGITGMRERVRRFGGHVLIESTPGSGGGGGTSITVAMPLASIASGGGPAPA
jgi:signal transduction histidine kinase